MISVLHHALSLLRQRWEPAFRPHSLLVNCRFSLAYALVYQKNYNAAKTLSEDGYS